MKCKVFGVIDSDTPSEFEAINELVEWMKSFSPYERWYMKDNPRIILEYKEDEDILEIAIYNDYME